MKQWKVWAVLAAAVSALIAALFGRGDRGPSKEERRLQKALWAEKERRISERLKAEKERIEREVDEEIEDLRAGGDDGFMDRALDHDGADSEQ